MTTGNNPAKPPHYWIYILNCRGGRLYTGITTHLINRFRLHLSGKGARFTRSFPPEKIGQCWRLFADRSVAQGIEAWIKSRPRKAKLQLIDHPEMLKAILDEQWEDALSLYCFSVKTANLLVTEQCDSELLLAKLPPVDYPEMPVGWQQDDQN